jgi:hypothetical protein
MGKNPMINKQNLRRFILEYAGRSRTHRYTQVAATVYDQIEAALREQCRRIVNQQPSAGRTIR